MNKQHIKISLELRKILNTLFVVPFKKTYFEKNALKVKTLKKRKCIAAIKFCTFLKVIHLNILNI